VTESKSLKKLAKLGFNTVDIGPSMQHTPEAICRSKQIMERFIG